MNPDTASLLSGIEISLATVRDYCDSADHHPELCISNDLKDVQRPWTLKTILGLVPKGARLLEIGAGEPLVAAKLQDAGYSVNICDPYDGSGNGPTEYDAYRTRYPLLSFTRSYFNSEVIQQQKWLGSFDAVYSISVLEHAPPDALSDIFSAVALALKPGGYSVHSVDAVVSGNGDTWHRDMIARVIACQRAIAGTTEDAVTPLSEADALFRRAHDDIEVFIMGPQGHNLWRGSTSYDKFPFRRCASVEVIAVRKKIS